MDQTTSAPTAVTKDQTTSARTCTAATMEQTSHSTSASTTTPRELKCKGCGEKRLFEQKSINGRRSKLFFCTKSGCYGVECYCGKQRSRMSLIAALHIDINNALRCSRTSKKCKARLTPSARSHRSGSLRCLVSWLQETREMETVRIEYLATINLKYTTFLQTSSWLWTPKGTGFARGYKGAGMHHGTWKRTRLPSMMTMTIVPISAPKNTGIVMIKEQWFTKLIEKNMNHWSSHRPMRHTYDCGVFSSSPCECEPGVHKSIDLLMLKMTPMLRRWVVISWQYWENI